MKIVFFGSPELAAYILEQLITWEESQVVAVVTQPDKGVGRGRKIRATPVKELAVINGIDVLQPVSLKGKEIEDILQSYKADLFVVVAYGLIIPKNIIEIPRVGTINVHASLLPKYRGAAPIQWAILNGEKVTGVTIMEVDEGMDTGPILLQRPIAIEIFDTAEDLHDKIKVQGASLLKHAIKKIKKNEIIKVPQDNSLATYAPKLTKEMGHIDFNDFAENIHNKIRALYPWPMAFFDFKTPKGNTKIQIYPGKIGRKIDNITPGEIMGVRDGYLEIACKDKTYLTPRLKPESSKLLKAEEFACGYLKNK